MTRYWGQIATGVAVALVVIILSVNTGLQSFYAIVAGVLGYMLTRWILAWVFRIRYWKRQKSAYSKRCSNCGNRIRRLRGDWVLECKRCGWRPNFPVLRWFTHSVPIIQLKRTVIGPSLVIVVIGIVVLVVGPVGSAVFGLNTSVGDSIENVTSDLNTSIPDTGSSYNKSQVEQEFLLLLNQERHQRGLQNLTIRLVLTDMGNTHAANMAQYSYVGHEWPDGTTIQDRYQRRGLLPECRLPIADSSTYYPGAENAAQTHVDEDVTIEDGSIYVSDEQSLAKSLFVMWMNSPLHKKAMLVESADQMGLGLNITDSGKVYAALELC